MSVFMYALACFCMFLYMFVYSLRTSCFHVCFCMYVCVYMSVERVWLSTLVSES